jgi:YVTN family beta-propeller protein
VAVVDDGSGKIVGDVPLGGRPVGIAVDDDGVWVTNADDGTVSRIDPETYAVVKTIGLGADVNGVAAGFGSIWVAGGNDETLYRIDPSENAIQAQLHLGDADPLRPRPIFFVTAGRDAVWVTRGNTLLRIDPKTTRVTKTVPLPGVPQDLGSGAGSIWVPLVDERLVRIDEGSATVASTTQLPAAAFMPIVVRDSLWLLLYTHAPQVEKLDPNTVTQTASVSFPNSFLTGLAGEGDKLWVVDHDKGRLWRIDANSAQAERLAATIRHFPVSIAAGHGAVWVGTQADHFR